MEEYKFYFDYLVGEDKRLYYKLWDDEGNTVTTSLEDLPEAEGDYWRALGKAYRNGNEKAKEYMALFKGI